MGPKTATTPFVATESAATGAGANPATTPPPAAKGRATRGSLKRKAEEIAGPEDHEDQDTGLVAGGKAPTSPKKPRTSARTKKQTVKAAAAPLSRSKKPPATREAVDLPPPPLPPAEITDAVAEKVKAVHTFIKKDYHPVLERDAEHENIIIIPTSAFVAASISMRVHYQTGALKDASANDFREAITSQFTKAIGETEDIPHVTFDVNERTAFEDRIHEKLRGHGLEDLNLVEIELETLRVQQLKQVKEKNMYDDDVEVYCDAKRFLKVLEEVRDVFEPLPSMAAHTMPVY